LETRPGLAFVLDGSPHYGEREGEFEPETVHLFRAAREAGVRGVYVFETSQGLREEVSQWVYVQRGLRLFDGPRIYLYKLPRLIDWTQTQAFNDVNEIIGSALSFKWESRE